MIHTTKGDLPINSLDKRVVVSDAPDAVITATEYWLGEELVRRDVHAALKSKDLLNMQAREL